MNGNAFVSGANLRRASLDRDLHSWLTHMVDAGPDEGLNFHTEGRYVNYFKIGYNALEFVFDFGQDYAEEKTQITLRVVMNSAQAKAFHALLLESIEAHERTYSQTKP